MSKPAGAVTAESYLYSMGAPAYLGTNISYMYFALRVPCMPLDWCDDDVDTKFAKIQLSFQLAITNDGVWVFRWMPTGGSFAYDITYTGPETLDYKTAMLLDYYPSVYTVTLAASQMMAYVILEVKNTRSYILDDDHDRIWTALEINTINDEGTPGRVGDAQLLNRTDSTARLYGPDMFLSAWHMKRVFADTLKYMLENAQPYFTVPVVGYPHNPLV